MAAGGFVQVATYDDRFGNDVTVRFEAVDGSAPLVRGAFGLAVLALIFLMRRWPPRWAGWVALVLAVSAFVDALALRIDPPADARPDLGVPLNSALNLEVLATVVCIIGCLICLRADGPVFQKRRDPIMG